MANITSSGGFKPSTTDTPLDIRTRVNTYEEIKNIPNPYIGMEILVLTDENNEGRKTKYRVESLTSNDLGLENTLIDINTLKKIETYEVNLEELINLSKEDIDGFLLNPVIDSKSTPYTVQLLQVPKIAPLEVGEYILRVGNEEIVYNNTTPNNKTISFNGVDVVVKLYTNRDENNMPSENYSCFYFEKGISTETSTDLYLYKSNTLYINEDAIPKKYISEDKTQKLIDKSFNELKETIDNIQISAGEGLTSEQAQQLQTAYLHSQTTHVQASDIPSKTSDLENDSGFLTSIPSEYVTEEEMSTALSTKANKSDIPSLEGYATETFVTNKIAEAALSGGEVDLSGYATKDDLTSKVDKVEGKSLSANDLTNELKSNYDEAYLHSQSTHVQSSDIPTKVSDLQNDSGFITAIPDEYVTETELEAKGYLTSHQDISGLQTKTDNALNTIDKTVVGAINELKDGLDNVGTSGGGSVDLTNYATDLSLTGSSLQLKNSQGNLIGNAITLPSTSGGASETVTVVRDIYANNEMPKMYVTSDRLGSLTKKADGEADCEVEIRFNRQIIKCYATGKVQGNSSESLPAKNYTFKFYSDAAHFTKNKIDVGWGKQSKYCFKKNYIDSTHTRNLSGARIAYDMVNSRPESDFKTNLLTAPRNGAVDGFPSIMYLNGEFWGLYTWNIPKDAWMFNMKDDNPNHMVLCAEFNNNGNMGAVNTCQFRALWGGLNDGNWSIEVGTYSEALKTSFNNAINFVMTASDEDFKANISNYFDLYSLLDYYCFSYFVYHYDGLGKNMLMATYDGVHWGACLYDMDSIYGVSFTGKDFLEYNKPCPEEYQENNSLLWQRIERCFAQELYDRYVELRKGALSLGNIVEHVEEIYDLIPDRAFKEDWTKWTGIPSQATNTLPRFRTFMKNRAAYVDSEFEAFDTAPKPVSGVLLDQYTITTNQNSPITLTATVKPNSAINKNVTWSCDDETVQLTPSGLTCEVNCPNLGTPRVTVTTEEGGFTASCVITVVEEGTTVTDGLVRYIDLALDEETKATNPTTIKDKVDDSITYNISGAFLLYNQQNITKDGVGWKESGLRGKQYSGSNGKIGIEAFQYQMPEQFTIECCQSFDNGSGSQKILSIRNSFNDMLFQVNTNAGKIQIQNGLKTINASYTFESNKLYHIAITYDGANVRLLINGVEVIASQAYAKAGNSSTFYVKPFGISDGANVEGTLEGLMCYFKIYNRVLTDNEIASNYAIESTNRVMDK